MRECSNGFQGQPNDTREELEWHGITLLEIDEGKSPTAGAPTVRSRIVFSRVGTCILKVPVLLSREHLVLE